MVNKIKPYVYARNVQRQKSHSRKCFDITLLSLYMRYVYCLVYKYFHQPRYQRNILYKAYNSCFGKQIDLLITFYKKYL